MYNLNCKQHLLVKINFLCFSFSIKSEEKKVKRQKPTVDIYVILGQVNCKVRTLLMRVSPYLSFTLNTRLEVDNLSFVSISSHFCHYCFIQMGPSPEYKSYATSYGRNEITEFSGSNFCPFFSPPRFALFFIPNSSFLQSSKRRVDGAKIRNLDLPV